MKVTLDEVQAFVSIARLGSFNRAATELNLSQSALSRRIALLEEALRARLFNRVLSGTQLTEAGHAFLPYALDALVALRDGADAVRGATLGEKGVIEFALTSSLCNDTIIGALGKFRAQLPDVRLSLHTGSSTDVSGFVLRGEALLGLRYRTDADKRLSCRIIGHERTMILCAPDHPLAARDAVTPEELAEQMWVSQVVRPGEPDGGMLAVLRQYGLQSRQSMIIDSMLSQKRLICAGFGVGLMPYGSVQDELRDGRMKSLNVVGMDQDVPLALISRRNVRTGPIARRLTALLADACRVAG